MAEPSTPSQQPQQPPQPSQGAPQSPGAPQANQPQPPRPEAQQDLPKGPVWDGDHEDHSWRAAAAKKLSARSRFEQVLVQAGPKRHPFPEGKVHVEEVVFSDGTRKVRYFRDQGEAQNWKSQNKDPEGAEVQTLSEPQDDQQAQEARERARAERLATATLPQTSPPVTAGEASLNAPVQAGIDARAGAEIAQRAEVAAQRPKGAAGSPSQARLSRAQRKEQGLE
jgi:hypothetical protein